MAGASERQPLGKKTEGENFLENFRDKIFEKILFFSDKIKTKYEATYKIEDFFKIK
jgi:hypothetical protein